MAVILKLFPHSVCVEDEAASSGNQPRVVCESRAAQMIVSKHQEWAAPHMH
jgi:hypothetical protein